VTFFIDGAKRLWYIPAHSGLMKSWIEVRNLCRSTGLTFAVIGAEHVKTAEEYGEWFCRQNSEHLQRQLRKYADIPVSDFLEHIQLFDSAEKAIEKCLDSDLWIFSNAVHAAYADEWCAKHGRKVPQDVSIISLENDHRCYHLGISYCDVDWEKIGYVMAHVITGALPVMKTTKGFIRTEARVVERLTTK
jgi:DNA-binding LacI/PurR family transcriptional regulator